MLPPRLASSLHEPYTNLQCALSSLPCALFVAFALLAFFRSENHTTDPAFNFPAVSFSGFGSIPGQIIAGHHREGGQTTNAATVESFRDIA